MSSHACVRLAPFPVDEAAGCLRFFRGLAGWFWALGIVVGVVPVTASEITPAPVGNFFQSAATLPVDIQRVLVLPLVYEPQQPELARGCETLGVSFPAELAKTRRFEVVQATPEILRSLTGRPGWRAEEALPPKFFSALREAYGCDAVLFGQLTVFKAYAPLSVGWRLRLVDARSQQTVWASDEVFDATHRAVRAEVRRHERKAVRVLPWQRTEDWMALHSPRRFGQIALAAALGTLPER